MLDFPDWQTPIIPGQFTLGGSGVTLVASTGVAVELRAGTPAKVVFVTARSANSSTVYVGTSAVTDDEDPDTGGYQLDPGSGFVATVTELGSLYINGEAGVGVSYLWWA